MPDSLKIKHGSTGLKVTENPDGRTEPLNVTKGIIIAGIRGGAGKTIATLGIIRALALEGRRVIPFKKGPDYIDARWMSMAAGHDCYNLDPWLMPREVVEASYRARAAAGDICIIEGNRGLHDGVDIKGSCSTAELAKWLDLPVLLVVDCTKITRTAAALVLGCRELDRNVRIAGIILNQIAGARHQFIVTQSIETCTDIPVLGAIPRMKTDPLPMRHLGLTPADEHYGVTELLDNLAKTISNSVNMKDVLALTDSKPSDSIPAPDESHEKAQGPEHPGKSIINSKNHGRSRQTIQGQSAPAVGIIRDQAFQFYYPENLEAIEKAGARLIFLNAIYDTDIPEEIDAIYIGGGFPETQAERLAANISFRHDMARKSRAGMPVYAECGGLMYLGQNIIWNNTKWPMTGIIDWDFSIHKKPSGHGYSILEVVYKTPFFKTGTILKGHEFHYSRPTPSGGDTGAEETLSCLVKRGNGFTNGREGIVRYNVFGTYTHVHALGYPSWGTDIVNAAVSWKNKKI